MSPQLDGTVYVFAPFSDRPANDRALRGDAHHVRELLTSRLPGERLEVDAKGCADFVLLPVDGQGRTLKSAVTPDGQLPPGLWTAFAETTPRFTEVKSQGDRIFDSPPPFAPYRFERHGDVTRIIRGHDEIPPEYMSETWSDHPAPGALPVRVDWDEPFRTLFPGVAAVEALECWGQLRRVLTEQQRGQTANALAFAETLLAPRRDEVTVRSTVDFWEISAQHDGPNAVLMEAEGSHGIGARTGEDPVAHERFQALVRKPATLPFLHGVLGYLVWLAVRDLKAGYVPRRCGRCGRILPRGARMDRRYCRQENPTCFRAGKAEQARQRRRST